jgi:hypothetical protein
MGDAMTDGLWCVHVIGPDDVHAAPSEAEARRAVAHMEKFWKERYPEEAGWGFVSFEAIPWPHSPESHARDVRDFYKEMGLTPPEAA